MTMKSDGQAMKLVALTSEIVAAHVANNAVAVEDVAMLVFNVHTAIAGLGESAAEEEAPVPAVPIRSSVKRDYIVCLEDGRKLKLLKQHLRKTHDLSPDEYRARWNLPSDYPMVAPAYAEMRRELAKKIGLGKGTTQKRGRRPNSG
ncbi:MAG: MucR family transcriptional regulator [Qipengyuania citrea]|uniref:MucR family transcriptional regulator n=1 Tax=Alphaproteobacteria TaxID=28211 RepID=UPI003265F7BC